MKIRVNNILTAGTVIVAAFVTELPWRNNRCRRRPRKLSKARHRSPRSNCKARWSMSKATPSWFECRMEPSGSSTSPESRKFIIDGRELTVHELKPGTRLSATLTTTTTPVTERTTTVGTGKVWFVSGKTVILTLPNNENRMYTVKDDYKFIIEGNKNASVFDLRKGMVVSAQRIVEEPKTEIASNTVVTGQAPPPPAPRPVVAQTPPPAPAPTQEVAQARPAPTPAPAPAPIEVAQAQPAAPTQLPNSGSELPLVGVLGLLLMVAGLGLYRIGRTGSV